MSGQLKKIKKLVSRFKGDEANLISSTSVFSETEARAEYIDPFFEFLGWDMTNSSGLSNSMKDIVREESQKTETTTKRPDYTFRIAGQRKFFVEAKRPSVDIQTSKECAFQTRSYGWTASLPISILTNFKRFSVYDTRTQPDPSDSADVGLLFTLSYDELPLNIDNLNRLFGRDSVAKGSIEENYGSTVTGSLPANELFLERINSWRMRICDDLRTRHAGLSIDELNDIAQKLINRIIFIRMCEDRGIEGEERLRIAAAKNDFLEIRKLFVELNKRYNTGLFDVKNDRLQDTYLINAQLFIDIVDEVYFPYSPYSFSVLDAEFLGLVYEQFLTKRLEIDYSGNLTLIDKPAYEDREVITTPQPLVDEVARKALAGKVKQLEDKGELTLNNIKKIRVLDIAVGSGRFLLSVLDILVDVTIKVLVDSGDAINVYRLSDTDHRLSFDTKVSLASLCLYGIDIDYSAVEISRFSLMIKLLEDESKETLPVGDKILPNFDDNIIWGNTVVDSDFTTTNAEVLAKTKPFSWLISSLPNDFDVVVGNPPYVKTEEMHQKTPEEMKYYKNKYLSPYRQFDKYFVFLEQSINKLNKNGWVGMVVPNKWITINAGKKLRGLFSERGLISEIIDFGNELVFEGKATYVCLLVLSNSPQEVFKYRYIDDYRNFVLNPQKEGVELPIKMISDYGENSWVLPSNDVEARLLKSIMANSIRLGDLCTISNGIQTSAEDVFATNNYHDLGYTIQFEKNGVVWEIEKDITKPYLMDSGRVKSYSTIKADGRVIFPYETSNSGGLSPMEPSVLEKRFPKTWEYLNAYKERLLERSVQPPPPPGVFYAYGRHQALETSFFSPKIIYSVNQRGDKYGIDTDSVGFASGGTAGEVSISKPLQGYELEFILGFLNQRFSEFFLRKRGSPFRGGYFSRGTAVISDLPIPYLDLSVTDNLSQHNEIVRVVREIIGLETRLPSSVGRQTGVLITALAEKRKILERLYRDLLKLSDEIDELVLPGDK